MNQIMYYKAEDVAAMLSISEGHAYRIIRELNKDLKEKGYITIAGRIDRQYFSERIYGGNVLQLNKEDLKNASLS